MANLEPITVAPAAFVNEAEKINAALSVCRAVKAMRGSGGIKVTVADANILISLNATFEEFTICENGTPATRWIATFTARP